MVGAVVIMTLNNVNTSRLTESFVLGRERTSTSASHRGLATLVYMQEEERGERRERKEERERERKEEREREKKQTSQV